MKLIKETNVAIIKRVLVDENIEIIDYRYYVAIIFKLNKKIK